MTAMKVGFVYKKCTTSANSQLFLRLQIYGFIGWKEQERSEGNFRLWFDDRRLGSDCAEAC